MILTCPSCSASYLVSIDDIGIEGRTVRCKKCQHTWFQGGEKKSLEDIISRLQESDKQDFALGFDDGSIVYPKKTSKIKFINFNIIKRLKDIFQFKLKDIEPMKICASFMVACACLSIIILLLVSQRVGLVKIFPSLSSSFEAAGFPIYDYIIANPEETFIIERLQLNSSEKPHHLSGQLINLSSNNVESPKLLISFENGGGAVIKEIQYSFKKRVVPKESFLDFQIKFPEGLEDQAISAKIKFTE